MSALRILVFVVLVLAFLRGPASAGRNSSVDSATGILPRDLERKGRSFAAELETELLSWDPASEPSAQLPSCLVARSFDPEGIWFLGRQFDATYLAIEWTSAQELRVELLTTGAMGEWRLTRSASLLRDLLVLDGPVKEYRRTDPFTQIHLVKVLGRQVLVPSEYLDCLMAALGPSPCLAPVDLEGAKACVFERQQ